MDISTQIKDWVFANESEMSGLAVLLAITAMIFMPLRALIRRQLVTHGASYEKHFPN